jgi:hypothetical protein
MIGQLNENQSTNSNSIVSVKHFGMNRLDSRIARLPHRQHRLRTARDHRFDNSAAQIMNLKSTPPRTSKKIIVLFPSPSIYEKRKQSTAHFILDA